MNRKKIIFGLALLMVCAVSLFFFSQQVPAQPPAKSKTGDQQPAKDDKIPDLEQRLTPKYAVINVTAKTVQPQDGKESYVKVYNRKNKEEMKQFQQDYKKYSENAVPLVVKVTLSPTQTYYILTCKIVNGKPLCW